MEKICNRLNNAFIKNPNLPENNVSLAVAGSYPEIIKALNDEGINIISFENKVLEPYVAKHSDMLLCHAGNNIVFADSMSKCTYLENQGFIIKKAQELKNKYPFDVKLNVAVGSDYFICNKKTCDEELYNTLILMNKRPITINQGYSKCSVCFVNEYSLITEDTAIYDCLTKEGFNVLLISKGDIYLSPKHYGFFGGSCGKISKDVLAITGELKYHKDADKIYSFCKNENVHILELTKGKIIDIGGILPLKERI